MSAVLFLFYILLTCKAFLVFKIGKRFRLYCSDNVQNGKTNVTKTRDKIMICPEKFNRNLIFFPYHPPLVYNRVILFIVY